MAKKVNARINFSIKRGLYTAFVHAFSSQADTVLALWQRVEGFIPSFMPFKSQYTFLTKQNIKIYIFTFSWSLKIPKINHLGANKSQKVQKRSFFHSKVQKRLNLPKTRKKVKFKV